MFCRKNNNLYDRIILGQLRWKYYYLLSRPKDNYKLHKFFVLFI